jgi:hypothetical protein
MSIQKKYVPNDISKQKQYLSNDMSIQKQYIPNDMPIQKQYIQNNIPIQKQYIPNSMSIQKQYIQNNIPMNKQYVSNDMSIQKNDSNNMSIQKQHKSKYNSLQKQNKSYDNSKQRHKKSNDKAELYKIIQKDFKSNDNQEVNKSTHKPYKPLFSNSINKKYMFGHDKHIQNRNQVHLNKILLESQTLIKNHKYVSAYYLLKNTIATGEYHSDLFYLYGEVNRILKNYKIAEDYLLLALNFEIHSPYVFYSMGLLYHNLKEYSYSNTFLKLFLSLINNESVHFIIAKNYMSLGEFTKAAKELTKSIEMNNENDKYYKIRSEVYNKMGLIEMSNEDLNMYNYIKNVKNEENK